MSPEITIYTFVDEKLAHSFSVDHTRSWLCEQAVLFILPWWAAGPLTAS
jgi:hypothetical protein